LRSHSIAAAIALILALGGCRDNTAPNAPFGVTVSLDSPPTVGTAETANGPIMTCVISLTVTAHGSGSGSWTGATELWFIGADRTVAADTTSNAGSDVQNAFGAPAIFAGQSQHATWVFKLSAPFEVTMSFGYELQNGQPATTPSTHFTCGPTVQNAVVPTVTQISVPNMSAQLTSGDTVSVSFQATASSGIWLTIVDATGAFKSEQVFGEEMATTVNRTVKFVVPPFDNQPGVPMTFSVRAFNAALVGSAKSLETQVKFVDHVPPSISSVSILGQNSLAGQFAVGDTLRLFANAADDNELGWLAYQIGAPANIRDSVPALPDQTYFSWVVKIVVRPEWVGTPVIGMYSRDAGGLTSQTVFSQPDSIRIYPLVTHPTTTPLVLSSQSDIDDMVYDAKRDLMYVGVPRDNRIVVFSPGSMTTQPTIALPGSPEGMDLTLSGDSLLVAVPSANTIDVIDLNNPAAPLGAIHLSVLDTVPAFGGMPLTPYGLRVASNGKAIVMLSNPSQSNDQTVEVDLTSGTQRIRTDARKLSSSAFWTRLMGRPDDRSHIYILGPNCGSRYDPATDTFSACRGGIGTDDAGLTFDATGNFLTRGSYLLDNNMQTLWWPDQSSSIAVSPDDANIFIGARQGITKMRYADKTMLERIPIPVTVNRLFVSPTGQWILAFESNGEARVTRVDLH
jgi:hypothetical protein